MWQVLFYFTDAVFLNIFNISIRHIIIIPILQIKKLRHKRVKLNVRRYTIKTEVGTHIQAM